MLDGDTARSAASGTTSEMASPARSDHDVGMVDEIEMTPLHARDVEHLVGQLFEMATGLQNVSDLLLIRPRPVVGHVQQLREAQHCVERCP